MSKFLTYGLQHIDNDSIRPVVSQMIAMDPKKYKEKDWSGYYDRIYASPWASEFSLEERHRQIFDVSNFTVKINQSVSHIFRLSGNSRLVAKTKQVRRKPQQQRRERRGRGDVQHGHEPVHPLGARDCVQHGRDQT